LCLFILSLQPRIPHNPIRFEIFLEGVAKCKCSIEIVGLNEKDVSKAITIIRSRIVLNEDNPQQSHRQCKLVKLGRNETLVIKLFQTNNENDGQIGGFESHEMSTHFGEYRKGFLLRQVSLGDSTILYAGIFMILIF